MRCFLAQILMMAPSLDLMVSRSASLHILKRGSVVRALHLEKEGIETYYKIHFLLEQLVNKLRGKDRPDLLILASIGDVLRPQ